MARSGRAASYIQPTGQTLLARTGSFMPGYYPGCGSRRRNFDYGDAGALSFLQWTNEYKAPWHTEMN